MSKRRFAHWPAGGVFKKRRVPLKTSDSQPRYWRNATRYPLEFGQFPIAVDATMSDEIICPECGAVNPPWATWCVEDGAVLARADGSPEPVAPPPGPDPAAAWTKKLPVADARDGPRTSGVRIHPPAARIELIDTRHGRVQLAVDNTAKRERRLTLSASDPDRLIQFHIEPRELLLKPNQRVMVELGLTTPPPEPGSVTHRTVTIVAEEGGRPVVRQSIAFDQRISAAARTNATSRPMHGVRQNRPRRPPVDQNAAPTMAAESIAARTAFASSPSARVARPTTRVAPPTAADTSATVFSPLAGGRIGLEPQSIRVDVGSQATFLVVADNSRGRETLRVGLQQADGDGSLKYEFRPDTFEVPPAKVIASTLVVTAPPTRQSTVDRAVSVRAVTGNDTVECSGTVVQSGSPWRWLATYLLPVLGAVIAVLGAVSPLTKAVNFYWFHRPDAYGLGGGGLWQSEPAVSQPVIRILITVLAMAMAFGLGFPRGRVTRVAAVLMFVAAVGYGLYTVLAPLPVDTGGMSYGFYLVVLGAVVGYIGGLLRRR